MANDVYYEFLQTPQQTRRVGARGGKATARNRRERLEGAPTGQQEPQPGGAAPVHLETTAAAIATLDAQFPWLLRVEKRLPRAS
jgi:hypothetical protein